MSTAASCGLGTPLAGGTEIGEYVKFAAPSFRSTPWLFVPAHKRSVVPFPSMSAARSH